MPPAADGLADDLIQVGCIGLIQALDGFRSGRRGASFETYARLRIRGAMLDELRRQDWLSKQSRQRWKALQAQASAALAQEHGRPATEQELSQRAGLDIEGLREQLLECAPATLVFLDALRPDGSGAWHEQVADPDQDAPDSGPSGRGLEGGPGPGHRTSCRSRSTSCCSCCCKKTWGTKRRPRCWGSRRPASHRSMPRLSCTCRPAWRHCSKFFTNQGGPMANRDVDGYPNINTADDGLVLTVYAPEGSGKKVSLRSRPG